jgi:hypothetical protein
VTPLDGELSIRVTFDLDDEERDTADEERDTPDDERDTALERLDTLGANELPPEERTPELLKPLPAA